MPQAELVASPSRHGNGVWSAASRTSVGSFRVLNTRVNLLSGEDVLERLRTSKTGARRPTHLSYVNAHSLNIAFRDDAFGDALARCQLVLNDGIGLTLAARMRGIRPYENLNGSDFTIRILELAAAEGWRVFLYGGEPGVAQRARDNLRATIEGLQIVGVRDGYSDLDDRQIAAEIRSVQADVVIVALGQPKQELWLDRHLGVSGCHLGVGVGAFLDFTSGRVHRAPEWMNRAGIEWVYRLAHEPRRLGERYLVGNPVFLWRAWRMRTSERPGSNDITGDVAAVVGDVAAVVGDVAAVVGDVAAVVGAATGDLA
jgi:exopolysaccharide biosynthesis WecB/TagA/CpsF family protein